MAVYILPGNAIIDSNRIPSTDYIDIKHHKKSIYDSIIKDKKEIDRLLKLADNNK